MEYTMPKWTRNTSPSDRRRSRRHYGQHGELAAMVAYLAGPEAGFVTGASLCIDGDYTA